MKMLQTTQTTYKWFLSSRNIFVGNKLCMTSTEVATALRPFYFAVHPDLFGQYPSQRVINENSLKQFSSFLETLQTKHIAVPCSLQFYVRDNKDDKSSFRLIKMYLKDKDLRQLVLNVLKACDLSTEYVDKIPKPIEFKPRVVTHNLDFSKLDPDDPVFGHMSMKQKIKDVQLSFHLEKWLNTNFKDAVDKCNLNIPVRTDISKLKKSLSERWGLLEVRWDCGWNEMHFRGCLQSFIALAEQHSDNMHILRGRLLVFAPFTGISLDGHIMLNSGEVRHNWLDLIKNVRKYDQVLTRIPAFEKSVSQVLRDIKIVRRKFMPKVLAGEYERNLQQITTSLSDYLGLRSFPKAWPSKLNNFELVVETEAGPLMVSPTGQFIVPSSIPGFLLVSFLTDNMKIAEEKMINYKKNKHVERSLHKECKDQLKLEDLTKDDNVTPDFMIECCERLLQNKNRLLNLNGVHLNIATYYSVLSDGVICIPWNWII